MSSGCRVFFASALCLIATAPPASAATQTDPNQYEARIAKEVQPYLSDCKAQFFYQGSITDPDRLAACQASQTEFAQEYYEALEGNQADKFDIGFMFQRGDDHGIKYNATMACAWWIEMENTGGRTPNMGIDKAMVGVCSLSQDAINEAAALQAEENRVASLTY